MDFITQQTFHLYHMKKLKCREHKIKIQIVKNLKMIRKAESPIMRHRLEKETKQLTCELDKVYHQMNDSTH